MFFPPDASAHQALFIELLDSEQGSDREGGKGIIVSTRYMLGRVYVDGTLAFMSIRARVVECMGKRW